MRRYVGFTVSTMGYALQRMQFICNRLILGLYASVVRSALSLVGEKVTYNSAECSQETGFQADTALAMHTHELH